MTSLIQTRPWYVVRWVHRRLRSVVSRGIDAALGVRTTFVEPGGLLQADDPSATFVKPCGWLTLARAFRRLGIGPRDVMVDFGSGTGRAVLVASLFPFRRVVGVEQVAQLHRRAQDNLARFRLRSRARVELVRTDALAYRLPDDVTVVFLYNPFRGETFREVMAEVLASRDRAPRRLRLIYVNPLEHEHLLATGRCRLVEIVGGLRPTRAWSRMLAAYVYEVEPARASPGEQAGVPAPLPSSAS